MSESSFSQPFAYEVLHVALWRKRDSVLKGRGARLDPSRSRGLMLAGVTLFVPWQRSEVSFPGEVDLRGFFGRPVGRNGPVRCNGAKVL